MLPEKNTKVFMGMLMAFIVGGSIDLSLEKQSCKEHHKLSNIKNNKKKYLSVKYTKRPNEFAIKNIIYSVAISPNIPYVFIRDNKNKITRLNVETEEKIELLTLEDVKGIFKSIAVSIDGRTIASVGSDSKDVYIRNISDQQQLKRLPQSEVTSLIFSPDGQILVSGSKNGEIQIWNLDTGTGQDDNILNHAGVTSLAISPDGQILASGSENGEIQIWNLNDGTLIYDLNHAGKVTSLAISPDGNQLVSGSSDGTVKIWSIKGLFLSRGKLLETYKLSEHDNETITLTIRQDKIVVSGHDVNHIKIWWLP